MIEWVEEVKVELVDCLASDDMVAMAAWVSHATDKEERLDDRKQVKNLINFLYRNRHMSPFEHGTFIFKVDVPLFVAREWHRHRTMSYNEISGRYTQFKPRFYMPDRTRPLVQDGKPGDYFFTEGDSEQHALVRANLRWSIENAWRSYTNLLEAGVAKEVARMCLPVNLMTQFYVTVNPRNLMQFLSLRNDKHALKEIRDAAVQMDEIFRRQMPLTHQAYKRYKITMVDQDAPAQENPKDDARARGGMITDHKGLDPNLLDNSFVISDSQLARMERWKNLPDELKEINYHITINNPDMDADEVTRKVVERIQDYHNRKPVRT